MNRRHACSLADERGSFVIEALVAAALLVILAVGFLASLDVAARSSGSIKSRASAASLAQDDVERLRAMKLRDLVNYNNTRTATVDGIPYTIVSRAQWVDDTTGNVTCPSGATKSDYLKVTSTVTWPVMGTTQPVKNETIVAVPLGSLDGTSGGLIVRIQNRLAAGVQGIPVGITGPQTGSGTTDADGCVFWNGLPAGSYDVNFNQSGWVDKAGNTSITKSATITGGATNSLVFDYDRGAKVDASFDTQVGASTQVDKGRAVTVANTGIPTPGTRGFTVGSPANTISTGFTLFPFTTAYVVWAGDCAGADPRLFGQTATSVTLGPAGAQALTLREPALNVRIQRGGTPYTTARVRITPLTPGCGSTYDGGTLTAVGALTNPGQPYGDYSVCADDGTRKVVSTTISNANPAGTSTLTLSIPTSGATGTCA